MQFQWFCAWFIILDRFASWFGVRKKFRCKTKSKSLKDGLLVCSDWAFDFDYRALLATKQKDQECLSPSNHRFAFISWFSEFHLFGNFLESLFLRDFSEFPILCYSTLRRPNEHCTQLPKHRNEYSSRRQSETVQKLMPGITPLITFAAKIIQVRPSRYLLFGEKVVGARNLLTDFPVALVAKQVNGMICSLRAQCEQSYDSVVIRPRRKWKDLYQFA